MTNEIPKMPSMKHLPWSQEEARQQKWLSKKEAREMFEGREIVIMEKMDGANACMTSDKIYARSHSGEPHREEWDYLKKRHREKYMHNIHEEMAIFGEYLYARHSIKYEELPRYFLAFGVYHKPSGRWLSWDSTKKVARAAGVPTAPVIEKTIIGEKDEWPKNELVNEYAHIEDRMPKGTSEFGDTREGYVIRNRDSFKLEDLTENMAKCVRENHVQTEELHWRKGGETETNNLL